MPLNVGHLVGRNVRQAGAAHMNLNRTRGVINTLPR